MVGNQYFNDLLPYFILLVFSWIFFIRGNFLQIRADYFVQTKLSKSDVLRNKQNVVIINFALVVSCYLMFLAYLDDSWEGYFFFNQCYRSNANLYLLQISIIFLFLMWDTLRNTPEVNNVCNNDFFFSLLNVSIVIPMLYYTSTLYSFIFVVELISFLIFYKFSVTKFWTKNKTVWNKKRKILEKVPSKAYISIIFFQYWVNFFSSALMLYSIIAITNIYGSTEWFFLNFINFLNKENWYLSDIEFNMLLWVPIFFGFFFKIGLAPTHLFKLEIYKGIPFITIFFYTTYYFLAYFLVCTIFFKNYLPSFSNAWWFFLVLFTLVGVFYVISLLFDIIFTKAFFAYSTVVNAIGFFIIVVATL